jgi:hypothetical protein
LPPSHLLLARSLSLARALSLTHLLGCFFFARALGLHSHSPFYTRSPWSSISIHFHFCSLNTHRNRQPEAKTFIPLPSEKPSKTDVTHINDIGVPGGSGQLLVEGLAPYRRYAPVHAGDQIWQVPLLPTAVFVSMLIACLCLCLCLCLRFALVLALAWVFAYASPYPRVWTWARASVCVCSCVRVSVNQAAQGLHFFMCVCPCVNPEPGSQFLDAAQLDAAYYCVTRRCLH